MSDIPPIVDSASKAINEIFEDDSVSAAETASRLKFLREEIDTLLDTLSDPDEE